MDLVLDTEKDMALQKYFLMRARVSMLFGSKAYTITDDSFKWSDRDTVQAAVSREIYRLRC